jgi:hypothetical protein
MCGIQNDLAIDKVDETVDILYDTTRKESCEIEIKRQRGKNKISGTINTVKE